MLLLIISLFLNYDQFSCVDYKKSKFNETVIMKRHHKNYLEVKTFIKAAEKKFQEDTPPSREDYPHYSTRDIQSRDDTSSIGLNQNTRLSDSSARARPSFPVSNTPYTTELNAHLLEWDEIFPLLTKRKSVPQLHIGPKLSFAREITSHPPLKITFPSPNDQKRFGPTLLPEVPILRINPVVSSTPTLCSKTFTPNLKNQKSLRPTPKTANSLGSTTPFLPNSTFHTSLRGHSGENFKFNLSYMTPNEDYKKKWLREITTYVPVESWFLTLGNKIGLTPSLSLTTKNALRIGRTLSKVQVSTPSKQLKTDSKHQGQLHLRNGLLTPETTTNVDSYSTSTATTKTSKFIVENEGGILHLRIIPQKNEEKTTTVGKRPVPVSAKDMKMKMATGYMLATTESMLPRDQETAAFKFLSKRSRLHLKPRKGHRYIRHRNVARQRYQEHYRHRFPEYRNNDVHRRKQEDVEYSPFRSKTHGEPTQPPSAMLQVSEYINTEDDNLSKLKETQKESRRREKAQKDKISFFKQVKDTLKQAELKTKAKRLKIKAELIRKIVDGSSYSDEEESLRRNLGQALQNGNRT